MTEMRRCPHCHRSRHRRLVRLDSHALHLWLYRVSGGRLATRVPGRRFLMLTTTGRKSGARYAVALEYHTDGQMPYVIASNYGKDSPPAWYLNLLANPRVEVEREGKRQWATASLVDAADRQRTGPEPGARLAILRALPAGMSAARFRWCCCGRWSNEVASGRAPMQWGCPFAPDRPRVGYWGLRMLAMAAASPARHPMPAS